MKKSRRLLWAVFILLFLLAIGIGFVLFAFNSGIIGKEAYDNSYRDYANQMAQMKQNILGNGNQATTTTQEALKTEDNGQLVQISNNNVNNNINHSCKGKARCFSGKVTHIVDGDTLDVDGIRIRFALVNTPEVNQSGYQEGKDFTANMCPVGTQVLVDEDDGQTAGSYGRMIALVYCSNNGKSVNEALAESGLAVIMTQYCKKSEFSNLEWAKRYGC